MKKSKFEILNVYTIRWKKYRFRKSEFVKKIHFLYNLKVKSKPYYFLQMWKVLKTFRNYNHFVMVSFYIAETLFSPFFSYFK